MIGYLRGKVLEHAEGKMLLAVGESSAVGYSVTVPQSAEYDGLLPGTALELYIHTHVREDALDLYGFSSRAEKELFNTLLSVNGIGPRSALGFLSGSGASALISAILEGDKAFLTEIPGVGKKTAERVLLELADPLRKKMEAGLFSSFDLRPTSVRAPAASSGRVLNTESAALRDAVSALVGLGYKEGDANQLLKRVVAESETPHLKPEDLIRAALQHLAVS